MDASMKKKLRDSGLVIERQIFIDTCSRNAPSDENYRKVNEALKRGQEIYTTDVRGKVISKLIPKDGAWLEEPLNSPVKK